MNLFALSGLLTGIANLSLGLFVYFKNRYRRVNQLFAVFSMAVATWGFGGYKIGITSEPTSALFWWQITLVGVTFIPIFFCHFVYLFLGIKRKRLIILIYLVGLLFLITNFTNLLTNETRFVFDSLHWMTSGPLFPLFTLFWFGLIIYAHYELLRAFKKLSGIRKEQIKYFFLATVFGYAGGGLCFLPVFEVDMYPLTNFAVFIYPIIMAYAIVKYRLMDIRIVLKRSTVYLTSLVVAVILGLSLMYLAIHYSNDISLRIIAPIALILSVILFGPIKKGLEIIANKFFFFALYSQQKTLKTLSQKLATTIDLDKLVGDIVKLTTKNFGLDKAAVLIKEPQTTAYKIENIVGFKRENGLSLVRDNFLTQHLQKTGKPVVYEELGLMIRDTREKEKKGKLEKLKDNMKHIEASICLPLLAKEKLEGIIVLGKKLSGDAYSKEDLEMLETLANQTSMAIENSRLYDQIKDLSKNLEKKVQEQTKDLKQANINLQKLLQMKTEFLTTVSHQLRTPLTPIRGLLSMLKERTYSEKEKQEMLDKVTISAERLNNITNDMLDAMELEGGYLEFKFEPVDLTEVIQEVIETLKPNYDKKKLYLKFQKPDELLPKIQVDPRYIKQLLLNLIDNAEKYTREGGTTISIDKEDKQIIIKISDTGCGLDKEDKEKLFQKFSRGKEADRYYTAGSGLGLFIVKRIIDEHQGAIEVESQGKDKGSTFIVKLPIVQYG